MPQVLAVQLAKDLLTFLEISLEIYMEVEIDLAEDKGLIKAQA